MKKWLLDQIGMNWLTEKFTAISNWVFTLGAFLLLCGGLVLAAFVERKEVATTLVFASTLLGTALLSLVLPKALAEVIGDEQDKARVLEDKLKAEKAEREMQQQLRDADREIARLERMQLSLTALKPVANLCLLSVEMTIKDFLEEKLGPMARPGLGPIPTGKPRQPFYSGAVEIPVKAHLGVDLQQVRIMEDSAGRLLVGGLKMTTAAETIAAAKFPLAEIRTKFYNQDEVVEIAVDPADKRLLAERDRHEHQLRERIGAGQSFTVFEKPLLQAAGEVLKSLLSPLEREIVFVEAPPSDATPLLSFLASEQKRIDLRRKELGGNHSGPDKANE